MRHSKGFTLIELLVCLVVVFAFVIIGIAAFKGDRPQQYNQAQYYSQRSPPQRDFASSFADDDAEGFELDLDIDSKEKREYYKAKKDYYKAKKEAIGKTSISKMTRPITKRTPRPPTINRYTSKRSIPSTKRR